MELRMRVKKSATGSVRFIHSPSSPVRPTWNTRQEPAKMFVSGGTSRLLHQKLCGPNEVSGASAPECCARMFIFYQLDLTTPGISPLRASERKQRRQTPNFRRKARGRPQSWQRLCWRDLNFGFLASLTRFAVVAMFFALYL